MLRTYLAYVRCPVQIIDTIRATPTANMRISIQGTAATRGLGSQIRRRMFVDFHEIAERHRKERVLGGRKRIDA
jgi:hypothetical protein